MLRKRQRSYGGTCSKSISFTFLSKRLADILPRYLSCAELLPEMVHTKDGSRVVREFLARGSAKVKLPPLSLPAPADYRKTRTVKRSLKP